MDWFERLTGFGEGPYAETRDALSVVDGRLRGRSPGGGAGRGGAVGALTLPSLAELRAATADLPGTGRPRLSIVQGDVRALHRAPENAGALFQVASQFNMLEMVGPDATPEHGVTRYAHDRTQGPACALAAGAATIWRNYLAPVAGGTGQTRDRQLDGLADLGAALAARLDVPASSLWAMRNGYALATPGGLAAVAGLLAGASPDERDGLRGLRGLLRVGLHRDVEVTDGPAPGPVVSQVFCSALPVAYSGLDAAAWAPFARLVLEAAYEATLRAAVLNAARDRSQGGSKRLLLTRLGGGAFGNADPWIDGAMLRALALVADHDLDVAVVSYGPPTAALAALVRRSGFAAAP